MLDEFLEDARWWAGLAPAERGGDAGDGSAHAPAQDPDPGPPGRGAARIRMWAEGRAVPGLRVAPETLCARWGITPDRLTHLAGEGPQQLKLRLPGTPAWVRDLVGAWQRFPAATLDEPAPEAGLPLAWLGPLLAWARAELRRRTPAVAGLPDDHPLLAPDLATLAGSTRRMLALELNAARIEGTLDGSSPRARYAAFGERLRDPARALDLLADHPVLARALVEHLRQWVEVRAECAERLAADLPALRDGFSVTAQSPADVADIAFGAGDAHHAGRTVAVLTFSDGARVVYKPRSLAVEAHLNALLHWVGTRGLRHPLRTSQILERPGYGWCAFVASEPCPDSDALDRFSWRLGVHLALFHVLGCSDMHLENLVAAGEHPAFIDLETMFRAEPAGAGDADADPVEASLRASVLAVGLLPTRVVETGEDGLHAMEISAMAGGAAPQEYEIGPELTLVAGGTDHAHLVRERRPVAETANRPVLDGSYAEPSAMRRGLVQGFEDGYRLLVAGREELLGEQGLLAVFATDDVRHVLRDTSFYRRLREESWHPDLLRDGLDRAYLLEALTQDPEADDEVAASERRQLARGDIPAFAATPGGTALLDADGVLVEDYFRESGLEAARRRLACLSEADLRAQLWFVHAALATRTEGGHAQRRDPVPAAAPRRRESDRATALAAAARIGDTLLASARHGENGVVGWPTLALVGERYWGVTGAGLDLYSGVTGVALFLTELSAATGGQRYEQLARDIVTGLADPDDMPDADDLRGMPAGGFEDLCGVLVLLTRAGQLWEDPGLLRVAESLVPAVLQNLGDGAVPGVATGAAGALLALLALDAVRPDGPVRAAVRRVGDLLLGQALPVPRVPGFAHGGAGQAHALSAVAALTGDPRFATAAARALAEDRSTGATGFGDAWCRGSAGILLAAAGAGRALGGPELTAVRKGLRLGVGNDSLCHGTLGLSEALFTAGESSGDAELVEEAHRAATAVAHRVLAGEIRTGVPDHLWVPGLMDGAAGIGYGLLRTALPRWAVPNVLLLGGAGPQDPTAAVPGPSDAGWGRGPAGPDAA